MKKITVNAVKAKCNECDNKLCVQSFHTEKTTETGTCFKFKPYPKRGFSFLELAISKSATAVNDLLSTHGLEFVPNDTNRGFDLVRA